jgi:hypothetical protein
MSVGALLLATSLAQAAPARPVRVNFTTPGNKLEARLFVRKSESEWALVCAAPCKADLWPGSQLRAVLGDHDDEPYDFVLSNGLGDEVNIEARRGGRGALAGGIVMTSLGGLALVVGIVLTAVSTLNTYNQSSLRTAGIISLGLGAGATAGGILMITGRTWEPRIKQMPYEPSRFAGLVPAATTPFSLTLSF